MIGKELGHAAAIAVATLLLAACGSGGGADTGSAGTGSAQAVSATAGTTTLADATGPTAAMTADNAAKVAGQAYGAANGLYGSGSAAAVEVKSLDAPAPSTASIPGVADFALRRLLSLQGARADSATKVSPGASQYCGSGGSMAVTILDADNDGSLSSGDSGSITFTGCKESGLTIDGTVDFADLSIAGSAATPAVTVGVRFVYRPLAIGNGQQTVSAEGGLSLQATIANAAPYTFDFRATGTTLTVRTGSRSVTLGRFTSTAHLDTSTGTYAYTTQGSLTLDGQGDPVELSSPTAMSGMLGSLPSAGVMVSRAADGSATRMTVTSPTTVTVETDPDGSGAWRAAQPLSWTQLRAL